MYKRAADLPLFAALLGTFLSPTAVNACFRQAQTGPACFGLLAWLLEAPPGMPCHVLQVNLAVADDDSPDGSLIPTAESSAGQVAALQTERATGPIAGGQLGGWRLLLEGFRDEWGAMKEGWVYMTSPGNRSVCAAIARRLYTICFVLAALQCRQRVVNPMPCIFALQWTPSSHWQAPTPPAGAICLDVCLCRWLDAGGSLCTCTPLCRQHCMLVLLSTFS